VRLSTPLICLMNPLTVVWSRQNILGFAADLKGRYIHALDTASDIKTTAGANFNMKERLRLFISTI